uniref:Uncharacterized protein n=1 Tax=Anguilla anguilla TaxID=7936 RepID=A0A0E9XFN1_ANGAN
MAEQGRGSEHLQHSTDGLKALLPVKRTSSCKPALELQYTFRTQLFHLPWHWSLNCTH